jgi:hypothetical protein
MAAPIFPSDTRHLCRGTWKASGIESERMELIGCKTPHAFYELVCRLFCKANRKFGVQYYAGSCAFTIEEYYFSIDQMSRMTDYGQKINPTERRTRTEICGTHERHERSKPMQDEAELLKEARKAIEEHPEQKTDIIDLYRLAVNEIEDGGSAAHEYELFMDSLQQLTNP